jgi:hypothetical protein
MRSSPLATLRNKIAGIEEEERGEGRGASRAEQNRGMERGLFTFFDE